MKMDDTRGLWTQLVLKVGRKNPTLVSLSNKVRSLFQYNFFKEALMLFAFFVKKTKLNHCYNF
jgi:hypothetical protein